MINKIKNNMSKVNTVILVICIAIMILPIIIASAFTVLVADDFSHGFQ